MAQKKKPNFFSSVTGALDDVIKEIKADVKSMTPPDEGKVDPRKAREQAELNARMGEIIGQSAAGLAVSEVAAPADIEPQEYEEEQPAQPAVAKPVLTMPTGNLWRALKDPALTQRLHGDACYHAANVGDIKHYYESVSGQKLAPFTLGILALNLPALTEEELEEAKTSPDLLILAMTRTVETEPRIYGAVGAGPRSLWSDPELLDDYLSNLLNENPKLIALGPVGLDEPFAPYTIPQQQIQLARQLEIAADFGLPVLLTCRNSHAQLGEVLSAQARLPQLVYLEPLTTQADADLVARFNMSVLLRTELTTPNQPMGQAYRALPQGRLLLGCGSSLVAPNGFSGHFNEPKFIQNTLEAASRMLNLKPAELLAITNRNLSQLFPQASAA